MSKREKIAKGLDKVKEGDRVVVTVVGTIRRYGSGSFTWMEVDLPDGGSLDLDNLVDSETDAAIEGASLRRLPTAEGE